MRTRRHSVVFALGSVAVASAFVAYGPSGCFYPDYTFDRSDGGGGLGPTSTHSTGRGTSTTTSGTSSASSMTIVTSTTGRTSSSVGPGGGGGAGVGGSGGGDCVTGVGGNMVVDCSNPDCSAFSCINAIPSGWQGYFALYDGPPAADPGCPNQFPGNVTPVFTGKGNIKGNAPVCECQCGTPTGLVCEFPTELDVFDVPDCNTDCVNDCCFAIPLTPGFTGACFSDQHYVGGTTCGAGHAADCNATQTGHGCSVSIFVPPATVDVTNASCPATGPTLKPDPVTFTLGRGCGDPSLIGIGCNAGQACLPKPKAPYTTGVCVMHDGDIDCPASQFSDKHVFYQQPKDDRGCGGTCQCGTPMGATCTAEFNIYTNLTAGCSALDAQSPFKSGTCTNLTGNPNLADRSGTKTAPTTPLGSGCTPDDSAVTAHGTAGGDETTATTFCCAQ